MVGLKGLKRLKGDLETVIGWLNVRRKFCGESFVVNIVADVGEEGAFCLDSFQHSATLINAEVRWVRPIAQSVENHQVDSFEYFNCFVGHAAAVWNVTR